MCLALGCLHPDYLLANLTSRQLAQWQIYYELEPWGSDMEFLRSGIVASTIANCHRDGRRPAFKPKDFVPQFGKPPGQTMEETKSKMNAALGALKQSTRKKKHG